MQHHVSELSSGSRDTHHLQVTQALRPRAYKPHVALPTSISVGPPKAILSAAVGHPILLQRIFWRVQRGASTPAARSAAKDQPQQAYRHVIGTLTISEHSRLR